ncbi:hypothetical protein, partial [Schlesneria sp.]|uniref:hypothetical protein n=1 Tax=Schlesneria sp. TaxID=2762018 RepID=UPI002F129B51
ADLLISIQLSKSRSKYMESLFAFAILAGIAAWAYKFGKQNGSRGGFRAGWRQRRNSRGNPK